MYTSRISASSTNYFEINLTNPSDATLRYLEIIFSYDAYASTDNGTKIDLYFDQGKEFAAKLEENLASKILSQNGILLNLAKGILDHDMKKEFEMTELTSAKESALRIIYRIWFIAYAESRNLLPVSDSKYGAISLRRLRDELDRHESDSDPQSAWKYLARLFEGIKNGSPNNNLPQYNGDLFRYRCGVDDAQIANRWLVPALQDMLLRDGDTIDYASLGVRHLGNILESVMEYSIQQAKDDVMLLVKNDKITQVKTVQKSNYSYKKRDLYLASKGGLAIRKSTASYYTPDEMVKFLVAQGLESILKERTDKITHDIKAYKKNPTTQNRDVCVERLLDIQVLDPTMGSGHFLVEALNQLTLWAMEILKKHPTHPLLEDLETDRSLILAEQEEKKITMDENLLTHDILLKRKIMKRCIFGADLNPMAVEISKLALWLDSFAIGVPLTYLDHHIKSGDSTIGVFLKDLDEQKNQSLDNWTPTKKSNKLLEDVSASSDVTVSQVHQSEKSHKDYEKSVSSTKRVLDALTASTIDNSIIPKKGEWSKFVRRFATYSNEEKLLVDARKKTTDIANRRQFFHWELEMRDAFTDVRNGFDVIVGNPPWDKILPSDDEFFTPYYPSFKEISLKTKKKKIIIKLLKDKEIKSEYEIYKKSFLEKSNFYSMYQMQGSGNRDISKLVLERSFQLLSKDGVISMVLPSQILASVGSVDIRKKILDNKIIQLYVFENRKKIFNIDSRYRFMLLTLKNSKTKQDKFPVGFYLHNLSSLVDTTQEKEKFGKHSKLNIKKIFSDTLIIPENLENEILVKLYKHSKLKNVFLDDGISISFSSGFHRTNDSDLFRDDEKGWPIHEGKTIHQYNHTWSKSTFTALSLDGLAREDKPKYLKRHREFYDSYRLVFRNTTSPTNMRTTIAAIIPPKTFHTHAMCSIILEQDGTLLFDDAYILYLCGVFNSTTFDFISRQIVQVNLAALISKFPTPKLNNNIVNLAAKLSVGHPDFAELAERLHIPNEALTTSERIDTMAHLDVLVAKAYGLNKQEYETILESFKLFKENSQLKKTNEISWNNKNLKEFYGEMRKKALEVFDEL